MPKQNIAITLASSSRYRQQLLAKLGLKFDCVSPNINETPLPNEQVADMVMRLSLQKAKAVAKDFPNHIVIASDQSASLHNRPLGKAGGFEQALRQLKQQQGQTVVFFTGLVVFDPKNQTYLHALDQTEVRFRQLSDEQLTRYLQIEQPFDCAGSFKSEGLGIMLFDQIKTQDPNALIGLPLIKLTELLLKLGLDLPFDPQ